MAVSVVLRRDGRALREKVLAQALDLNPDGTEKDDGMYHGANAYIDYRKGFRRAWIPRVVQVSLCLALRPAR